MPRASHKLKERRLQLGLTQAQLASRAIISKRTVQLAEKGQNVSVDTLERISEVLSLGIGEISQAPCFDALQEEPWSLYRFVTNGMMPERSAFCRDLHDARNTIEHMHRNWEIHLRENADLSDSRYATAYRTQLEKGYDQYERKYLKLWRANSHTIIYATSKGTRNGISVILPVTDKAYSELKTGTLGFMEINKKHICEHSQNLVIDSGVEFRDTNQKHHEVTTSLRFASFFQVALLSEDLSSQDFRMLSFGASSTNAKRLEANGFRKCSAETPELGFAIYEFAADNSDLVSDHRLKQKTVTHFANELKYRIPKLRGLKTKRRMILKISRLYQSILNRRLLARSRSQAVA